MNNNPSEMLARGSSVLEPLFRERGFSYRALDAGGSSGGGFACGEFRRNTRSLELHFRHGLGMVTYRLGSSSMSHQEYMRSILGRSNTSHHPGFSSDPLDGFRHLYLDIEEYGKEFLEGTDECLLRRIEHAKAQLAGK